MIVKAIGRKIGISPRKARLVADSVKGMNALYALNVLEYMPKGSALHVGKVLKSAIYNAKHNYSLKDDTLIIKDIRIDKYTGLRRIYYTGKGGARFLLKPYSHITVELSDGVSEIKPAKTLSKSTKLKQKESEEKEFEKKEEVVDSSVTSKPVKEKKLKPNVSKKVSGSKSVKKEEK